MEMECSIECSDEDDCIILNKYAMDSNVDAILQIDLMPEENSTECKCQELFDVIADMFHNKILKCLQRIDTETCDTCLETFTVLKNHFEMEHSTHCTDSDKSPETFDNDFLRYACDNEGNIDMDVNDQENCDAYIDKKYKKLKKNIKLKKKSSIQPNIEIINAAELIDINDRSIENNCDEKKYLGQEENKRKIDKKKCKKEKNLIKWNEQNGANIFKNHICNHCNTGFEREEELQTHQQIYSNSQKCQCFVCGEKFIQVENISLHLLSHIQKQPLQCPYCDVVVVHKIMLPSHIKETHTLDKYINYTRTVMLKPVHKDKKIKFQCRVCTKIFNTKHGGQLHNSVHSEERNYICTVCNQRFKLKEHLRLHVKARHMVLKPYVCEICGHSCTRRSNLLVHMQSHSIEKKYKCHCGKQFASSYQLKLHKVTHTGVRNYECDMCGRRFLTKKHLEIHINSHTGVKKYECSFCLKRFTRRANMRKHTKLHANGRLLNCDLCDMNFIYITHLKHHMETNHKTI